MTRNSILLTCLLLSSSTFLSSEATSDSREAFQQWKRQYGKTYATVRREQEAFRTWQQNQVLINQVNQRPNGTWKAGLNQYADMTVEEFRENVLVRSAPQHNTTIANDAVKLKKSSAAPSSFDWRYDGQVQAVTRVRDQGSVGSCWAFSTAENIEGQWALAGNALTELSPEFLVDCDGTSDEHHADCSVFGGWPYLAYQYVMKAGGIPSEQAWPYCAGTGECYPCMQGPVSLCGPPPYYCDHDIEQKCGTFTPAAKISSWTAVSSDEEEMKSVLFAQGPLSVLLDASQLQFYKSGVWDGEIPGSNPLLGCKASNLNHAVLLVGYGEETSSPYWTVKNSWGQSWGEEGYFRITRGSGKCGINTGVTTALV